MNVYHSLILSTLRESLLLIAIFLSDLQFAGGVPRLIDTDLDLVSNAIEDLVIHQWQQAVQYICAQVILSHLYVVNKFLLPKLYTRLFQNRLL